MKHRILQARILLVLFVMQTFLSPVLALCERRIPVQPANSVISDFTFYNQTEEAFHPDAKKPTWHKTAIKHTAKQTTEGGPSTPEVQAFKASGEEALVNLFTGDFNYNIPLLDVGGYMVNLSYNSGIGVHDEASWVGLGWNLNPGAVNRTVRGLPDDFKGQNIRRDFNLKPNETTTMSAMFDMQMYGFKALTLNGSIGVTHNNYKGWSLSQSTGASIKASDLNGHRKLSGSLSFELGVDSREGGFAGGNIGLAAETEQVEGDLGMGMHATTRDGLEELSFSAAPKIAMVSGAVRGAIQYVAPSYQPKLEMPMRNRSTTFHFTLGGEVFGLHMNGKISGAHSEQKLLNNWKTTKAYGYLYTQYASINDQLDFNREKDGPYQKELPNLGLTSFTHDLYQVSGAGINELFRPFRGDIGMLYDPKIQSHGNGEALGGEIGAGNTVHGGIDFKVLETSTQTQKWETDNALAPVLEFRDTVANNPLYEPVYFKSLGEQNLQADSSLFNRFGGVEAIQVALLDPNPLNFGQAKNNLSNGEIIDTPAKTVLNQRVLRNTQFSWRTAEEMVQKGSAWSTLQLFAKNGNMIQRVDGIRKAEHIAQIEVTAPTGIQYLYSVPAYNQIIKRVSFNIGDQEQTVDDQRNGLVSYNQATDNKPSNQRGENHFYNAETTPAHAYAWLLSAVLSPDYVDVNQDGPSPDDFGTYTKFQYNRVHSNFKWRTPQQSGKATFDERFLSDEDDNQGHYTYGEKEVWYLDQVETRNYIAVFETSDREDVKGVSTENGNPNPGQKLKKLDKIKLYTQQEFRRTDGAPVPLKTVHFEYDYSLSKHTSGSDAPEGGKLTLKRVWFTYMESKRDEQNPYLFDYQYNPDFVSTATDRWGNFKPDTEGDFNNERFPYNNQKDRLGQDTMAASWSLTSIVLPSGGYLKIQYESDDYGYVQNKQAMEMCKVLGFSNATSDSPTNGLGAILHFELPAGVRYNRMEDLRKALTMDGELYFNMQVLMKTEGSRRWYEYVESFTPYTPANGNFGFSSTGGNHAWIRLNNSPDGRHPVRKAGYNLIRSALPEIEDDATFSGHDFISVLPNFMEKLTASFQGGIENHYDSRGFCNAIASEGSFIRVNHVPKRKMGGGLRVRSICTGDNWGNMQQAADEALNSEFIQNYKYITVDPENGDTISSGVAAYEPMIGNEENPWVQPIKYVEERTWAASIDQFQIEPIGESFMPAPLVGYSKVITELVDRTGKNTTGHVEHQFFTAKEFPIRIERTPLIALHRDIMIPAVVYTKRLNAAVVSQGFVIETNDMHGKDKSTRTFDANGIAISGVDYVYNTEGAKLNNRVPTVSATDLTVRARTLGLFWDIVIDARQYVSQLGEYGGGLNIESAQYGPVPVIIPVIVPDVTEAKSEYRGITITKYLHRTGILNRVVAFDNGASIATENQLWDANTGRILVTATEHAFNGWRYSSQIPAYWTYPRMGQAATNADAKRNNVPVVNGRIALDNPGAVFAEGDEIWLLPTRSNTPTTGPAHTGGVWPTAPIKAHVYRLEAAAIRIIRFDGTADINGSFDLKIMRSGYRNQPIANVGNLISTDQPVRLNQVLNLNPGHVLASSAQTYSDFWQTDLVLMPTEERRSCDCREVTSTTSAYQKLKSLVSYLLSDPSRLSISPTEIAQPGAGGVLYQITAYSGASLAGTIRISSTAGPCPFTLATNKGLSLDKVASTQGCQLSNPVFGAVALDCRTPNEVVFYTECRKTLVTLHSDCIQLLECAERVVRTPLNCDAADIDPYLNNILGCWRPDMSFLPVTGRMANIHVTESGFLTNFQPFWVWNAAQKRIQRNSGADIWERAEEITTYNAFGAPLETRDAINRSSSMYYGHGHTLSEASATNAKYTDIGYDGFEEYHYYFDRYRGRTDGPCMMDGHFMFKNPADFIDAGSERSAALAFISNEAHTGNYSLKVNAGTPISINKLVARPGANRGTRSARVVGETFRTRPADKILPFEPQPGKYVLSVWVHEDDPRFEKDRFNNAQLVVSIGSRTERFIAEGPIIDGWQQINGEFDLESTASNIQITMSSLAGQVLFDDLRVHPFNASLTTQAYDGRTLRIMANHDAQNFAQFFEYNSEGKLARQKRETEKGIITLIEVREGNVKIR